MTFKALGYWVAFEDPREKKPMGEPSDLIIPDEVRDSANQDANTIQTNILTVQSVGDMAKKDFPSIQPGQQLIIDPRTQFLVLPTDDTKEKYVILIHPQQICGQV